MDSKDLTLEGLAQQSEDVKKPTLDDGTKTFPVKWRRRRQDPMLEGVFTIRVPSLADDAEIARLKVVYSGGLNWAALDPADQQLFEAMALCHVLVVKKPAFFNRPIRELDRTLILGIAGAIRQWEVDYFRGSPDASQGEAGESRLEILPSVGS